LLAGHDTQVPDAFTGADLEARPAATDRRLQRAAEHAAMRVTQYLAGVPELQQRYRNAPPAAQAVIDAALTSRARRRRKERRRAS
jgi:hypothetical protein